MDIEEIEAIVSGLSKERQDSAIPYGVYELAMYHLLLHIYKKLESIEQKLEPARPLQTLYSRRLY